MYLLLQKGVSIVQAIEDALENHKFQLAYTLLHKVGSRNIEIPNEKGQNLMHILGMNSHECADLSLVSKIFRSLSQSKIELFRKDSLGRYAFHYALKHHGSFLVEQLLARPEVSQCLESKSVDGENALTIYCESYDQTSLLQRMVERGMNVNGDVRVKQSDAVVYMGMLQHVLMKHKVVPVKDYQSTLDFLCDSLQVQVNRQDSQGETPLLQAVKNNNKS